MVERGFRCDLKVIVKQFLSNSESKPKRLRSDRAVITQWLHSNDALITKRLQSNYKTIAKLLQRDCKATAK
jgi:hypothetical protein